ncbi:uncharacterized [Tachysurus ichikawai]
MLAKLSNSLGNSASALVRDWNKTSVFVPHRDEYQPGAERKCDYENFPTSPAVNPNANEAALKWLTHGVMETLRLSPGQHDSAPGGVAKRQSWSCQSRASAAGGRVSVIPGSDDDTMSC